MAAIDPELDTGIPQDDWFNQNQPDSGVSYPDPTGQQVGTATNPNYNYTGSTADPWGQMPGNPNYGYPPQANTPSPTPTPTPTNTGSPYGPLNAPYGGSMPDVGKYTPPPFTYDAFKGADPFAPPSADSVIKNDPGYQFRLGQGTQALEQSAAARGTLNTGGTLQDLVNYGQSYASGEYNQAYNRALGTYQTNYGNALNSYITNFGNALAGYNSRYQTQYLTPFNQLMQQYGINDANYTGAQDRAFGQQFATATA
jgi:hypothetical protein